MRARETLTMLLESWGHHVKQAEDGETALDRVAQTAFDVTLIDVGLPRMDGYALARALRATASGAHLRLVALTGYSRDEDRRREHVAGFDAYLVKPLDSPGTDQRAERASHLVASIGSIRQASCTFSLESSGGFVWSSAVEGERQGA
jgi:CheY-like chemotaxis protein